MNEVNIYKFDDNVKVYYTDRKISLPQEYRDDMEKYWESILKQGRKFFRGDIFTITNISYCGGNVNIYVELTDYAHFLYTLHRNEFGKNDCRVIYTSVLVETSDERFVIGVMNNNTFAPKKLQLVGGGIDKDDIDGSILDLKHNIRKEIAEELGLDINDKKIVRSFKPYLLKSGGKSNFLSAIFKLDLSINEVELMDRFNKYNQGITPELSSLVLIKAEKQPVENFIKNDLREKDENLIPTLKAATGLYAAKELSSIN